MKILLFICSRNCRNDTIFLSLCSFLTIFPIQLKEMPSKQQNGQSLLFYPLIGLMIGAILFAIAMLLHALPVILLSSLILVVWIWLTGGLHLDGLADTADAWVGGFGNKERTLKNHERPELWANWGFEFNYPVLN